MKDKKTLYSVIDDTTEEEEKGTWLQTFADMSMLLLTFFILMYSFSSIDKKIFNSYLLSIKKALKGKESSLVVNKANIQEEGILLQEAKLMHEIIKQQQQVFSDFNYYYTRKGIEGIVGAKFDKGKIIIEISGDVLFPSGEVRLSQKGKETLKKLKDFLIMHPNEKISIVGHTDDVPPAPGSRFKDNWEISALRALSVLRYLVSLGLNPDRMMATGLADTKPLVPNTSPENRAKNRRVEIILERDVE